MLREKLASIIIVNYGGDSNKAYRVADMMCNIIGRNETWHGKANTNG